VASQRVAKDLVLSGVAFVVVFAVPFFPFVLTAVVWEFSSMSRHWLGTLVRLTYVSAALLMAITAWRRPDVKLAVIFLAVLAGAVAFVVLSNWRWH
jgi:hypothetical protein